MNQNKTKAWRQYEAGKDYKRKIGLYETIRNNERFYRGDQWRGVKSGNLPRPVFNLVRRVIDYLVCSVASGSVSIAYTDETLPFMKDKGRREVVERGLAAVTKNAAYRWEKDRMDRVVYSLVSDAALAGDGVLYCYWDKEIPSGQIYRGDIVTERLDNVNLFVADVNRADLQSQEYIILSGRQSVASLRREAAENGVEERAIARIAADEERQVQSGDLSAYELEGEEEAKATYLIKFWREKGKVVFEKSTEGCVIRRVKTDCRLYPVAYFNWIPTKNSFHGTSPITGMIPNQKFINRAYAMVMKHMTDTAFSKVIYDKTRIPEWSNEVGEAIAAVGGTNVSDAVSVVGVGQMQNGYLELIRRAIEDTKELMGATETALGNTDPTNTSAILAMQEATRLPLDQVKIAYYQCLEDLANIWVDMMCAYYPPERLLSCREGGTTYLEQADFALLREAMVRAKVEVTESTRYSAASAQSLLDKLLDGGHISIVQYLRRVPDGLIQDREELCDELIERGEVAADGDAV